jgi:hypothetical protein
MVQKIAFCFLSYGDIEQPGIWSSFFAGVAADQYTTLLHRADGVQTSWAPECTVIPHRPTKWGTFSLVEAQQELFVTACKDPAVTKCILLSGDSIPIHSFQTIYAKLTCDSKGYMKQYESDQHLGREQTVNKAAWPSDTPWSWPIAHQWVILTRAHIQLLQENWTMLTQVFGSSQIPDEQVYIVFFKGFGFLDSFHDMRTIRVNWNIQSDPCSEEHRSRPRAHHTSDFTPQYMNWIYAEDAFFLRKLCKTATVTMDWSAARPLVPVKGHRLGKFNLMRRKL